MRWTLAIDTAGASGGVALGDGENIFFTQLAGRSYSAQLVSAADSLFQRAGTSLSELSLLAVVSGPGSFTGIRVGLSIAKAWAETTNARLIAASRLALCAASIQEHEEVRVALDAGRGEFFLAQYSGHGAVRMKETLVQQEALLVEHPSGVPLFVFEPSMSDLVSSLHVSIRTLMRPMPTAVDLLAFATRAAGTGAFADPLTLNANYMRRSDAELFSKPDTAEATRQ